MRFVQLLWITTRPGRAWVGSVTNKHNPSSESGLSSCISSRITTVIHVRSDHQVNYNCFNEPFAVSPCRGLYWDMHGLIFETSIWLLAGSTRFLSNHLPKLMLERKAFVQLPVKANYTLNTLERHQCVCMVTLCYSTQGNHLEAIAISNRLNLNVFPVVAPLKHSDLNKGCLLRSA